MLAAGFSAMTAGCAFQYGLPYLIPALRAEGLSLAQAGLLVACPLAGLLVTLVAWGAAADRWSERLVLSVGLGLAGLILIAATTAEGVVALGAAFFLAGAAGASVHAASGRLILGWFVAHERGFAMAVRQTAQPLGVAVGAVALPPLAALNRNAALLFLGTFCLAATLLVLAVVRDPQRAAAGGKAATGSPYRTPVLWRIHGVSALLIVPQFAVATYGLVYLVDEHGWTPAAAGRLLAVFAVGGAAARLAAGYWSDRVASRLRPLRILASTIGLVMLALGIGMLTGSAVATLALLVAAVITVSTNGLAFTAVAEYAGASWAGRALGVQNTVQNAVATAIPLALGGAIGLFGYGRSFTAVAVFPLLAVALVPVASERLTAGAPADSGSGKEDQTVTAGSR
ncbi:Major facilitator superfamily MFS_1 [Carbonactinospora thermoautotrophica]|uniref:Major facilitator superfamily MFS_1 n=2 Tax=Carbonactinospora thermoautotrophica TaxID=1469144 RepID=A0A132MMX0_9ACTN|nr:Major facilitator superfamily MFS_1 [Carbonactinospora thermoautotrophica]